MKKSFLILLLFNGSLLVSANKLAISVEKASQMKCLKNPSKIELALECLSDCDEKSLAGKSAEIDKLSNVIIRAQFLLSSSCKLFIKSLGEKEQHIIKAREKDYEILVKGMNALGCPAEGAKDLQLSPHVTSKELP